MTSPSDQPQSGVRQQNIDLMFKNHLQISWRAGLYTVVPVLTLGGVGRYFDHLAGTLPLFLITGCIFGFILGLVMVYRSIVSLTTSNSCKKS